MVNTRSVVASCKRPAYSWHHRASSNSARPFSQGGAADGNAEPKDGANIRRMKAKLAEREFFQTVLGASATKRDAKSFLARFDKHQQLPAAPPASSAQGDARVNLGSLYRPNKAVAESPTFSFKPTSEQLERGDNTLNVAVVKLYRPQTWSAEVLSGVAKTLAQLSKLGVRIAVVLDDGHETADSDSRKTTYQHAKELADTLNDINDEGARLVDQSFILDSTGREVSLAFQSLLLSPLRQGAIVVIPPLAHTQDWRTTSVTGNQIVLALTESLSTDASKTQNPWPLEIALNRIIYLDEAGGVVDSARNHIFVNLMQDFDGIQQNLTAQLQSDRHPTSLERQLGDLSTIRICLSKLPPTASALFATPLEVALSVKGQALSKSTPGVSTRPQRNTLIHNILTDKPLVSSSLPPARTQGAWPQKGDHSSTFFKYGMPVSIVPDVSTKEWLHPGPAGTTLDLRTDPRIDLPRLVHLIEDSFGRKLDVDSYLGRIANQIAGVIVVGDYEGGAILTWEKPTDRPDRPMVPYLDKFAVLRRCQGSGGVADIVFNAMVRQCFPAGVVWRSRRNNPVNKWYFERSNGTWKLPDSNWTMFWTGNEVEMRPDGLSLEERADRWRDYVAVCSNIQPSWADNKS